MCLVLCVCLACFCYWFNNVDIGVVWGLRCCLLLLYLLVCEVFSGVVSVFIVWVCLIWRLFCCFVVVVCLCCLCISLGCL